MVLYLMHVHLLSLLSSGKYGKNVIFGLDNTFSIHAHNRTKYHIFGERITQGLDDTSLTAET